MAKYVFCSDSSNNKYNAGSKAVNDATRIATNIGYMPQCVAYYAPFLQHNRVLKFINLLLNILISFYVFCSIRKQNTYFLQWPGYAKSDLVFFKRLIQCRPYLIILIHDIDSLRCISSYKEQKYFYKLLDTANVIIAHSENMKHFLASKGVNSSKIQILTCFDYLSEESCKNRVHSNKVVFAGNLNKSPFLNLLDSINDIRFYCYGLPCHSMGRNVIYKGKFRSECISVLEGSWGLVWDGDSLEKCSGVTGNYLRFNSPHKLSLYIAAKLPILIWKESAMADYVVNNNIGYAINSINEISSLISSCTYEEYNTLQLNIEKVAEQIKNGNHLRAYL